MDVLKRDWEGELLSLPDFKPHLHKQIYLVDSVVNPVTLINVKSDPKDGISVTVIIKLELSQSKTLMDLDMFVNVGDAQTYSRRIRFFADLDLAEKYAMFLKLVSC